MLLVRGSIKVSSLTKKKYAKTNIKKFKKNKCLVKFDRTYTNKFI